MSWTRTAPRCAASRRHRRGHVLAANQAGQSAGGAQPAQADPARADACRPTSSRSCGASSSRTLEEQLTDPASLAITRVRRTVSPYAKDDVRYIPTIEEEIERYQSRHARPGQEAVHAISSARRPAKLAIVGDFDPAENLKILRDTFSGWIGQAVVRPHSAARSFPTCAGGLQQIITPDKANAVYVAGDGVSDEGLGPRLSGARDGQLRVRRRLAFVAAGRSRAAEGRPVVRRRLVHFGRRARSAHQPDDQRHLQSARTSRRSTPRSARSWHAA